ncbi:phosphoglycerate dehydrogenase [candidate division KSB1 bacterium]|nr:phosphoglycerate dehydrogenase [candidate division KSB1 bacterium]
MNILCTTSDFGIDQLPSGLILLKNPHSRKLTETETIDLMRQTQPVGMIAGTGPLTRNVFREAKQLKVISRCGVGIDAIDLEAAREHKVAIFTTPDAPVQAVAEMTLCLILGLLRKIHIIDSQLRQGQWKRPETHNLAGKTVGIVGCGRIGSRVAALLSAFECPVVGYDPHLKAHTLCRLVSLDRLISESDIISLHAPLTPETRHLINQQAFQRMRSTAIIVNTARGALIHEPSLLDALQNGRIAGAAMDVFENEPYSGPLLNLPEKTLLSPHIASSAIEARQRMEQNAVENLIQGLRESRVV